MGGNSGRRSGVSEPTMKEILAVAEGVLTGKELEAWRCYHVLEWSYAEVAAAVGADRSTVQRRVKRANDKLEVALQEAA